MVFHDVSEMKRLERVRQEFVANVSHELRTPLTAIKGYAEALLEENLESSPHAAEFLKVIDRHAARMEKIVADLLLLSQLESPARSLRKEPIDVPELLQTALDSVSPWGKRKSKFWNGNALAGIPPFPGDSQKIHQMLVNLLQNAINYTPEGGRITLEVRRSEAGVQFEVADTGIGIPAEDLPRIFERFYRVDKGRSREAGRNGIRPFHRQAYRRGARRARFGGQPTWKGFQIYGKSASVKSEIGRKGKHCRYGAAGKPQVANCPGGGRGGLLFRRIQRMRVP